MELCRISVRVTGVDSCLNQFRNYYLSVPKKPPNILFYDYLKIQELKANEHQLFKLKKDVNETQKKVSEMEQLKKQLKDQSLTLSKIETENLNLAQKLHENLEEMKSVMKERDNLRRVEETLKLERDQLMESLQETKARVSCVLSLPYHYIHIFGQKYSLHCSIVCGDQNLEVL